jgi:hypothetical protein
VFGLGALLALHDLGVHERVVSMSSVSGESIANGAVMPASGWSTGVTLAALAALVLGPAAAFPRQGPEKVPA